ncbi:hypothetical protein INR49_013306, partial [Caranx melampygus]
MTLRMLWRITIPVILAGVLCITAETKKSRPQGSIPSPYKTKGNLSSERHHRLLQQKPEVLSSSREALVVTERRYLRRDWCKTQPLRQTISEEGCRSRTVVNRFCYGQCNSFYIPRHMGPSSGQGQNRGQASGSGRKNHNKAQEPFQSCSFCRPHRITQLTVQLDCPDLQPPFRHRKVQRVKQCRCMSVDVTGHGKLQFARRRDKFTFGHPDSSFEAEQDVLFYKASQGHFCAAYLSEPPSGNCHRSPCLLERSAGSASHSFGGQAVRDMMPSGFHSEPVIAGAWQLRIITVVRFPHCTRDIGSVPLDGHGGVGWEPELTPHNNCLAVAVPPVTQSNWETDSEGEGEEQGTREPWRGQLPGPSWRAWGLVVVEARSLGVGVEVGGPFQAEGVVEVGPYPVVEEVGVEVRNQAGEEVVEAQNLVVEGEVAVDKDQGRVRAVEVVVEEERHLL